MSELEVSRNDIHALTILRKYLDSRKLFEKWEEELGKQKMREILGKPAAVDPTLERQLALAEAARDEMDKSLKLLKAWRRGKSPLIEKLKI